MPYKLQNTEVSFGHCLCQFSFERYAKHLNVCLERLMDANFL